MLGVYHDDPALPTIRSQIYHLCLSSNNISRDIDILSVGLMVYRQTVSLFCLRIVNIEIDGTQNQYPQKDYSEIISLSHQVIGLPVRKAQMLLKDLDLCMITYTWNDVSQITLEVVFKTSTLTCLFNQNDICEAVYQFLTDNKDLMKYISHCVKTYTYDFLLDGWTTDKCHISICRSENQGCFLLILPLKKIL